MRRSGSVHGRLHYNCAMRSSFVLAPLVVLVALAGAPAVATPGSAAPPGRPPAAARAEGVTLEQAVQQAEKRYQARAVKAEEHRKDGRRVYRIRLLSDDGRVFDVTVDAATGRMD